MQCSTAGGTRPSIGRPSATSERTSELETAIPAGQKAHSNPATIADPRIDEVRILRPQEIPVYVADYVLMRYGTGAIMAVPAEDERGEHERRWPGAAQQPRNGGPHLSRPAAARWCRARSSAASS